MISAWDDFPVHQSAEPVRLVATSDRNCYDRYYFNCHASSDELFLVMGMGQYPNLGTQDAFAVVRRGPFHRVVRASRELGDRSENRVGPFRIEVLEPLRRLRFVLEPTEHGIAFDLDWTGAIPAWAEPRHFIRRHGRVLFDTSRFAQTGCWSGTLTLAASASRSRPSAGGERATAPGVCARWASPSRHFPAAGFSVTCTPLLACFVAIGTGYGMDADWRHGMHQGRLVVQGLERKHDEIAQLGQYGVVDHVARFEYEGGKGFGLYEHAFIGAFERCGLRDGVSGAP